MQDFKGVVFGCYLDFFIFYFLFFETEGQKEPTPMHKNQENAPTLRGGGAQTVI
jgi:hypothetical protein